MDNANTIPTNIVVIEKNLNFPEKPTKWDILQKWCIDHSKVSMLAGFGVILIGVVISKTTPHWIVFEILSHFFIIAGEAIFVMFFLHQFVEKLTARGHEDVIKKLVNSLTDEMKNSTHSLMEGFRAEAEQTTRRLKRSVFEAILHDQMPHEMVDVVLKSRFFDTKILRKNLQLKYDVSMDGSTLLIVNDLMFTMIYTAGSSSTLDYKMPFSLTDTSEITYDFENASFNFKDDPETIVTETDFNVLKTVDLSQPPQRKEQDLYELKVPIVLRKDQELIVKQRFTARYENFNGTLNDIYYVNQHTMNVSVEFKYKGQFAINIHPTFQHSIKPKQSRFNNEITYSDIPFLVPGQGYMFSIKKIVAM